MNKAAHQCDQGYISIGFIPINLDQLDQSFMYTQVLKEILLIIGFNEWIFL
jgi:hypothetical protein